MQDGIDVSVLPQVTPSTRSMPEDESMGGVSPAASWPLEGRSIPETQGRNAMMKQVRRLWAVALLAVGVLLLGAPASVMAGLVTPTSLDTLEDLDSRFGSVRVVVVDENGAPVEGAVVELANARTRRLVASGETDENGQVGFRRVRTGLYGVSAGGREIGQGTARTEVRANQTSQVRIRLHRR
jgi:hypothetical protein